MRAPSCACGPTVQGAALVLENKTGRILAMAGGFSYPLSQLNRVTQAARQPGSSFKPLIYLAALRPRPAAQHARCYDAPITLPPIGGSALCAPGGLLDARRTTTATARGVMTLRRALENSKQPRDRASARRRHREAARRQPQAGLHARAGSAASTRIAFRYYPFVLGAQPVRRDRSRDLLRRHRQRRHAAGAACGRVDRARRRR